MTIDREKLKAVAEGATPGPWRLIREGIKRIESEREFVCEAGGLEDRDAEFIVAANPATVLGLLAEIEQLKHDVAAGSAREWDLRSQVRSAKESRARVVQSNKAAREERDQLKAEVARSTERELLQLAEIEVLRNGMVMIIEMNRQHAEDQYGDAEKAESWGCVTVAREAMRKVAP